MVFGLSKSGIAAADALLDENAKVFLYDESENAFSSAKVDELIKRGAKPVLNRTLSEILPLYDVLVLSPGIPVNHELAVLTKKAGKRVIGEIELGYLLTKSPIVAVTGTNGKTTTVSIIDKILARPHGIVLLTGPTGSGKSTTLYAFLKEINTPSVNIVTVEDPVEYTLNGVNQTQINNKANMTVPVLCKFSIL